MDFLDEQRMCRLYEKFILEYYKKHYPKLTVSASQIPWSLDDGIGDMLPVMQSDIHLQKENTVLIIDAKYYTNTTQVQFDKHTLHSNNLYQIFTYVKNREYQFGDEDNKVSGMLLYARSDVLIQPDNVYQIMLCGLFGMMLILCSRHFIQLMLPLIRCLVVLKRLANRAITSRVSCCP